MTLALKSLNEEHLQVPGEDETVATGLSGCSIVALRRAEALNQSSIPRETFYPLRVVSFWVYGGDNDA